MFNRNFHKISISSTIAEKCILFKKKFEESRFLNNFDYSHDVRKISFSHQFFLSNFSKNLDFIQNFLKNAISHNVWEMSIIFQF